MAYAQSASEGKTRCERIRETARDFGLFLYNKEKGEVMGRNGKSWAKITVFFIIFYSCLAAFFAAMLAAFMSTVPPREEGPKLTQYLAGKQGLVSVPRKIEDDFGTNREDYLKDIEKFLKPYEEQRTVNGEHFDADFCEQRDVNEEVSGKQCRFNLTTLGPCYGPEKNYGYTKEEVCIFVRMNKVFDWVPEPSKADFGVELDCYKEDKEDGTDVKVYPEKTPGFPTNYYPYKMQDHWLAPVAAVHVSAAKDGDVILCEANAKNLEKSETFRLSRGAHGKIRIEIGD